VRRKRNIGKMGSYLVGKEFVRRKRDSPLSQTQPLDIQSFPLSAGKTSQMKNDSRRVIPPLAMNRSLCDDRVLRLR
jgi:hypothetical protein